MDAMRSIMRTLKLTINEEKTHVCRAPDESFDFLGYTFGRVTATKRMAVHHQASVEEEDSGDLSPNQRVDQPAVVLAGRGRASGSAQPDHGWLGALLLPRAYQPTVPDRHRTCLPQAPSVVASEAQSAGAGIFTLPERIPASETWPGQASSV